MTHRFGKTGLLALALSALTISASSCNSGYNSKSSYPTAPGPVTPGKELNSGDFGSGGVFQHTFASAGTYHYHCVHHGPMTGTVVVDASAPGTSASVSIVSMSSPFASASVKPGGTVTWTNNTPEVHTVTSD